MTDTQTTSADDLAQFVPIVRQHYLFYYYLRIFFQLTIRLGMLGLRLPQSRKLLYAFRYPPSESPACRTGDLLRYKSVWRARTPDPARLRSSDAPLHSARLGSREMSSRRKFLQDPPDPAIIAFAEELGRMLARREFARLEQPAERLQRDEEGDHGQSCDLRPILIRPAEPSLD